MKKSKLSLEELKVESFVVNNHNDQQTLVGGSPPLTIVIAKSVIKTTGYLTASIGGSIAASAAVCDSMQEGNC